MLLTVVLLVTACSSSGSPGESEGAPAEPSTSAVTTTEVGPSGPDTTAVPSSIRGTTPSSTIDTTSTSTTAALPAGRRVVSAPSGLPPILVAGTEGIGVLGEPPIVSAPSPDEPGVWLSAIPDGAGGLVYAGLGDGAQIIWWWPTESPEPLLISFKPGRVLHDVATIDERIVAVVTDDPDPFDDDQRQFLQLIDVEDGTITDVVRIADRPFEPVDVRFRAGWFVVITSASAGCGQLFAVNLAGERAGLDGIPEPLCSPLPYRGVAFAPDGSSVAVLEELTTDTRERELIGTDLVVYERGQEKFRIAVAGPVDQLGREDHLFGLDYDGRWVVIGGRPDAASTKGANAIVVDTSLIESRAVTIDVDGALGVRFVGDVAPTVGR